MAIKNEQKGICWIDWPEEVKDRHSKAVKEAEKTYTNYGGIREGASGSVKFIVETAEIK